MENSGVGSFEHNCFIENVFKSLGMDTFLTNVEIVGNNYQERSGTFWVHWVWLTIELPSPIVEDFLSYTSKECVLHNFSLQGP
jgi:hypothetical protein